MAGRASMNTGAEREFPYTQREFNYLRRIANERTGILVPDEKFDMFYARLSRRLRKLGLTNFQDYCDRVRDDPDEALELVNAITTNLTSFFREQHHFDFLARTLVREHLAANPLSNPLRIWSAGCSTGEEPYSIAITLLEALPSHRARDLSILATDIDSNVLRAAAAGVYGLDGLKGITEARLRRWFLRGTGANTGVVRVKPEVQQPIEFGRLNLMDAWEVGEPMDAIFCRNVIIYFGKEDKARLIERYANNLKDGGYLFIGHSESLFRVSERFDLLGQTIYRKRH